MPELTSTNLGQHQRSQTSDPEKFAMKRFHKEYDHHRHFLVTGEFTQKGQKQKGQNEKEEKQSENSGE